jgi:hypothetical protein
MIYSQKFPKVLKVTENMGVFDCSSENENEDMKFNKYFA